MSSLPRDIGALVEELRRDNLNGATILTQKACRIVKAFLDATPAPDHDFAHLVSNLCAALGAAQPMAAPVINLCLKIRGELSTSVSPLRARERIHEITGAYEHHMNTSIHQVAEHALRLFKGHSRFLTHSFSSAVMEALLLAGKSGRQFSVCCTESRPQCEGAQLGLELARNGIRAKLIADAALFSMLHKIDCVLVGADSVSLRGIVNKVGTRGVALAAQAATVPLYVLCGSEKFLPVQLVSKQARQDPAELFQEVIPNLEVHNEYYDCTPLEQTIGIVTENGLMSISQLHDRLSKIEKDFADHPLE